VNAERGRDARRSWIVDLAVLSALALIGLVGFASVFADGSYLVAALGGLVLGTAVGVATSWRTWGPLRTLAAAVACYFLFGSALAMPARATFGILPNFDTLNGLAFGAVFGWKDIVTLVTPVSAPEYIAVVPYLAALIVGFASATIARRRYARVTRTPLASALAVIGPLFLYLLSVFTGTHEPYLAAVRGILFAVIALTWIGWRPTGGAAAESRANRVALLRRRIVGITVIVAVAVGGGGLLGAAAAPSDADRVVVREVIEPPFDPLLYPSPLSGFRKYTKQLAETVLLTASGLRAGDRIRIATMDSYDGRIWNVTDPALDVAASGSFRLAATRFDASDLNVDADAVEVTVQVAGYADVWLPSVGYPTGLQFVDVAPDPTAIRFNDATDVFVVTSGVRDGMTYELGAVVPDVSDAELQAVSDIALPPISGVPDAVAQKAADLIGDAATPIEQLRAIESAMSDAYLSHGSTSAGSNAPSLAGHGADRMNVFLTSKYMVGDGEQYASAFALMARSLGFPARVVLGFAPEVAEGQSVVDVVGEDIDAWVEVDFDGVGWVPFYPTPEDTDVPLDQAPAPRAEPQAIVRQPPQNPNLDDQLVSPVVIEDSNEEAAPFRIPAWVWTVLSAVGIPLALYFVPLILVALLKKRRVRLRRTAAAPDRRAAGAWDELVDRFVELGYRLPASATRLQTALDFEQQFRDEVAARALERESAKERAEIRREREELKKARALESASADAKSRAASRMASVMDETVVRARGAAAWRPGVEVDGAPLPVLTGLREFAVRSDAVAFGGREVDDAAIAELWTSADSAADAAEHSVSWFRRRLAGFRLHLPAGSVERLTARLNGLVPRPHTGVAAR